MKANELMIGDWVNYHGIFNKIAPADFCHKEWIEAIKPIPLTAEILEKNRFEKENLDIVLRDEFTEDKLISLIKIAKGFALVTEGMAIGIQYVHELQHIYKLCGIKKEIEL